MVLDKMFHTFHYEHVRSCGLKEGQESKVGVPPSGSRQCDRWDLLQHDDRYRDRFMRKKSSNVADNFLCAQGLIFWGHITFFPLIMVNSQQMGDGNHCIILIRLIHF